MKNVVSTLMEMIKGTWLARRSFHKNIYLTFVIQPSIHNYLFYTGQLPFAQAIKNRSGGIVNTVGKIAADLRKKYLQYLQNVHHLSLSDAAQHPYEGASETTWISAAFNLTNEKGQFIEYDGSVSRVVHQFDRFGLPYLTWLDQQDFVKDDIPTHNSQLKGSQQEPLNVEREASAHRTVTETGVAVSDPQLWEGEDLQGDSSTATVMGMATGYPLSVYQRFVGTLRKTGYKGRIILGVAPDVSPDILDYFQARNVTPKILHWSNCTYRKIESKEDIFGKTTCEEHYPDIKIRWSRFPLQADWLRECIECTGPVLVTDVRDTYFQQDPFGPGSPLVQGLQVFEEHPSQTTDHWITDGPISRCKGMTLRNQPMLCSGTTVGTRIAMLKYLEIMYEEMKVWISDEKCRFDMDGDDQR
jgi:hypothetical protein